MKGNRAEHFSRFKLGDDSPVKAYRTKENEEALVADTALRDRFTTKGERDLGAINRFDPLRPHRSPGNVVLDGVALNGRLHRFLKVHARSERRRVLVDGLQLVGDQRRQESQHEQDPEQSADCRQQEAPAPSCHRRKHATGGALGSDLAIQHDVAMQDLTPRGPKPNRGRDFRAKRHEQDRAIIDNSPTETVISGA
jgi:hypothetical protein